jgi:hypothetical protein|tara:strand:+ start:395 stop:814 length:420 start_codon:yes stop_codon:yes gene_type:complete
MAETKRFKNALWEDLETKERIRAREVTEDGSRDIVISRGDTENFKAVIAEFPEEVITARTQEDIKKFREERDRREAEDAEMEKRRYAEELFQAKLTIFELPEIKNSSNRSLKRRLRKAETFETLNVYAAAVVVDYDRTS